MTEALVSQPIVLPRHPLVEVVTLIGARHLPYYLFTIDSLLKNCHVPFAVTVLNDGTLEPIDYDCLRHQVRGIRIFRMPNRDDDTWRGWPLLGWWLERNLLLSKLAGLYAYARLEPVIQLDADVLFFREPTEVTRWATAAVPCSLYNADSCECGSVLLEPREFEVFESRYPALFNSGLLCTMKQAIDLDMVERILAWLMPRIPLHAWVLEQTLWAVLIGRLPFERLAPHYVFVNDFSDAPELDLHDVVTKHYSGGRRRDFFLEGVRYLYADPVGVPRRPQETARPQR